MKATVELIAARALGEEVRFAVQTAPCPRTGDPEATARAELATLFPSFWLRKAIVRSTSWRYEDDRIVLTYLGYSDEFDVSRLPLAFPLARITDLERAPASVAADAIRHLAFFAREDPATYGRQLRPETMAALRQVPASIGARHRLEGAA